MNNTNFKILMIVPCYNEQNRLKPEAFLNFSYKNHHIHFLFVDDGSTDNTKQIIEEISKNSRNTNHLILSKNVGKGEAIRQAIFSIEKEQNNFDYIGYIDADLSVPLQEIINIQEVLNKRPDLKLVLSIRVARLGASIQRNFLRHYLGRFFATIVSLILKESIYDSQCGLKLLHSSIVFSLFRKKFISSWIFDVELIARYKIQFPDHIKQTLELPLNQWHETSGSKLRPKHYLNAIIELFKIWIKYGKSIKNN